MGGMELRNPLIALLAMRESVRRTPKRILEKALEQDESMYLTDKQTYERRNTSSGLGKYNADFQGRVKGVGNEFMPREEYFKYREECSSHLAAAYDQLLLVPEEKPIDSTPQIERLLSTLPTDTGKESGIHWNFSVMDAYWKTVVAIFGPEVVDKYGSLQMVDPGQVPLGIVSVMKAGKMRWKG
jgi:hypothetical protein